MSPLVTCNAIPLKSFKPEPGTLHFGGTVFPASVSLSHLRVLSFSYTIHLPVVINLLSCFVNWVIHLYASSAFDMDFVSSEWDEQNVSL
jgi:hypothetical protein